MTKSELDSLDSIFLAPVCLIVNQAMGTIFPEVKILWACFVSFYFILFANINLDKGGITICEYKFSDIRSVTHSVYKIGF